MGERDLGEGQGEGQGEGTWGKDKGEGQGGTQEATHLEPLGLSDGEKGEAKTIQTEPPPLCGGGRLNRSPLVVCTGSVYVHPNRAIKLTQFVAQDMIEALRAKRISPVIVDFITRLEGRDLLRPGTNQALP